MQHIAGNPVEELKVFAPQLDAEGRKTLTRMYSSRELEGTTGKRYEVGAVKVSVQEGSELNRLLREHGARRTLEIGFAFGFSTIWILDALAGQEDGFHIALDPFETSYWGGVGLRQVSETPGFAERFKWMEERSALALADMIRGKQEFDAIFIDGNHRFDDVLVDFYLADQVLKVGGLVAFDDMWMDSIKSVASFVVNNRSYRFVPQRAINMAVFVKTAADTRNWQHYNPFATMHVPFNTPIPVKKGE